MYIALRNFKNGGVQYPVGAEYRGEDFKLLLHEKLIADLKDIHKEQDEKSAEDIKKAKNLADKAVKDGEANREARKADQKKAKDLADKAVVDSKHNKARQ